MRTLLSEPEAKKLLKSRGIAVPREALAGSEGEALEVAKRMGYPVVLKAAVGGSRGRSASGCIALGVSSGDELRERFGEIKAKAGGGDLLVQELLPRGREVVVGMMRDEALGPVLMFSLGGVFTEVVKDISFRPAPVTREDALAMVKETKAYPILKGSRGGGVSDTAAIAEVIEKVSELGMERKELVELEINPLFVYEKGAVAVNAKAVVEER